MEMEPFRREDMKRSRSTGAGKGTKRKRNTDPNRNIPPDMPSTFTSASTIWKQFTKKRKVDPIPEDTRELEELGEDDDMDKDIEAGFSASVRRTQSDKPQSKKRASSPGLRRSATAGRPKSKKLTAQEKKMAKAVKDASLDDLAKHGEDDEVDLDIETGILASLGPPKKTKFSTPSSSKETLQSTRSQTIEVSDTEDDDPVAGEALCFLRWLFHSLVSPDLNNLSPKPWEDDRNEDMGWLVDDDEDMLGITEVTAPLAQWHPTMSPQFDRFEFDDESIEISQAMPLQSKGKQKATFDVMSSSPDIQIVKTNPGPLSTSFLPASKLRFTPEPPAVTEKPKPIPSSRRKTQMLPPPVPSRNPAPATIEEEYEPEPEPEPTYPVKKTKRRRVEIIESSDGEEPSPRPQHRLRRQVESTPVKTTKKNRKPKRAKPSLLDKETALHFDGEAAHSGDEVSEGFSEDDEERSSDREFIKDSPLTQRSPSYQQTQMYRQGLFTQAPMGANAPVFAKAPTRPRPFGRIGTARNHLPSSSPPPPDEELDEYEFGSFIVPDDGGDVSIEVNSDDDLLDF
jgi:ATP-dependent DNA helicase MPH1